MGGSGGVRRKKERDSVDDVQRAGWRDKDRLKIGKQYVTSVVEFQI